MKVSVIIVTKDRPNDISRCLNSIQMQSHDWHQVIIIDSSQGSDTAAVVQKYNSHLPIIYSHSDPGITKQRNMARELVTADSDIVLYIDDDVVIPAATVSKLQDIFSELPEAIGVTGQIKGEEPHELFKRTIGRLCLVYTPRPYGISRGLFNIINVPMTRQKVEWLPGAFMAYRWQAISDVKFDEWFTTYGLAEDLDFSLRVAKQGSLYADPELIVEHNHSAVGRDWKRFGEMRIVNRNYIRKKHFPGTINWLGYWWANYWLIFFNGIRGLSSTRFKHKFIGNIKGVIKLLNITK